MGTTDTVVAVIAIMLWVANPFIVCAAYKYAFRRELQRAGLE
jgi:hypothetical protein